MKKKLDQYAGRLSAAQIAEGMNAARRNAGRLVEAAEILLEAGHSANAASLAILSIEESGKSSVLRHLAVAKSDKEVASCWRDFRSHTQKNSAWLLPDLFRQGARRLDDFRPLFDASSDHSFIADQLKQIGLYVDCLGQAHWSVPDEVVSDNLARGFLSIARLLIDHREITEDEIELWIECLGPVWGSTIGTQKQGLINWTQAMRERGIDVGDMASFVSGT